MKRFLGYILAALLLSSALCSCSREGKVIPRGKLSRIYAEMFLADSWLSNADPEVRMQADTTAFYAPIFEKYGYTVEDYWNSIEYYLKDPERFARILSKSEQIIVSEMKKIQAEIEASSAIDDRPLPEPPLEKVEK